jgi:two-component system, cell cycle response regulator CpdR
MGRILLVEDHDQLHRLLCDVIAHAGHEADCVKTQAEALELLAPASHHLVVADVILPDGNGHSIAERAADLGIKSILMSGHPDELQALAIQQVIHLAKPFAIREFEQVLEEHVND